jgi:hypothetical protein
MSKTLPQTPDTLVLRTDFHDDASWQSVCEQISSSSCEGYVERYTFVSDSTWIDFPQELMTAFQPPPYFYLVVDRDTIEHEEHPVLAVNLSPYGADGPRTFRLLPAEATSFACNMNLANMDFEEFAESADADGIFRGFPA